MAEWRKYMSKKRILIIGSSNLDFVMNMYKLPEAGETIIDNGGVAYIPGGRGASAAIAFSRLGAESVFCSKLGADIHGQKLYNYCKEKGVLIAAGLMMRFGAYVQAMKKAVSEGKIGKPVSGYAQFTCWYPDTPGAWRQSKKIAGGGAMMDMGVIGSSLSTIFGEIAVAIVGLFFYTRTAAERIDAPHRRGKEGDHPVVLAVIRAPHHDGVCRNLGHISPPPSAPVPSPAA